VTAGSSVTGFRLDDEVIGWSDWRSSHADFVVVNGDRLAPKPLALDWIRAGGLFIVGVTAYAAVRAVAPKPGESYPTMPGVRGPRPSSSRTAARAFGSLSIGQCPVGSATILASVRPAKKGWPAAIICRT
jgi:hypothetical protein